MLKPLVGIAFVAIIALPVVAQVRHHRAHQSTAAHVERNTVDMSEEDAAMNASVAAMEAASNAAQAAAEAAGDYNMAVDATYDANADMSMDTNMSMDENMTVTENMSMDVPAPRHRRRARPRHQ